MIRTFSLKQTIAIEVVTDFDEATESAETEQVVLKQGEIVQVDVISADSQMAAVQFGNGSICFAFPISPENVIEVATDSTARFETAKYEALAKKFHDAGYAVISIDRKDFTTLGIDPKIYDNAQGWETLCHDIYEALLGAECPPSHARGRGFRSQHYGDCVADAIRQKFCGVAAKAVAS